MIGVFVNPQSRANRRNPRLASEFQTILGSDGRVIAPRSLPELATSAFELRAAAPAVIAVHGGDGTLHKTLTALVEAWGDAPLPPLAVLCGGTMNVVASSYGIRARPETFLRHVVESTRAGLPLETMRRRCIRVTSRRTDANGAGDSADQFGFIFGNGLFANFLNEYYAPGGYGTGRAIWLLVRLFLSAVVFGPFVRRVFQRFRGAVRVDGRPLSWPDFTVVGAGTIREVGLRFKLNHRADDDPERFGVIAIHAGPLSLVPDLVGVYAGRGIATSRAFSTVASSLEIDPANGSMGYTIDGDLYRGAGPVRVSVGPSVQLVRPAGGSLIRTPAEDTMNPRMVPR